MPKASTLTTKSRPQKIMVYGPSGSGKTELVARLAEQGYQLYWIDLEKGFSTVLNRISQEGLENITVFDVTDTKEVPRAAEMITQIAQAWYTPVTLSFCDAHCKQYPMCRECYSEKLPYTELPLETLQKDRKSILVIDSVTQLHISILNYIALKNDTVKSRDYLKGGRKFDWDDYGELGNILGAVLNAIQTANLHIIAISHETEVSQVDSTDKIVPAGGTRTFARNNTRGFDHVIYCSVENRKHKVASLSVESSKLATKTRSGLDLKAGLTLADLLEGRATKDNPEGSDSDQIIEQRVVEKTPSLLNKLLKKDTDMPD